MILHFFSVTLLMDFAVESFSTETQGDYQGGRKAARGDYQGSSSGRLFADLFVLLPVLV